MEFVIKNPKENILSLARRFGYRPAGDTPEEELVFVRSFNGRDYPRFHLYVRKGEEETFIFNLHLDQKRPSYARTPAHGGEYEGETVEKEVERIKRISAL